MPSDAERLAVVMAQPTDIDKYMELRRLYDEDPEHAAFYRMLMAQPEKLLPYIYTPTVGEACQRYHQLPGLTTHGLYLTLNDAGGGVLAKLRAWPQQHVRVVVMTDGERILGLGDLGTGGMGISEGKITLYTVAAGVDPLLCLPVCLDVGTNNKALLDDPSYPGLRQPRVEGAAYDAFLGEVMDALHTWQPHALIQFEDFGNHNAFRLLQRFRGTHCCFNDDIEGTASITLAALLSAIKVAGTPLAEQRILFMGAGEAGTGIAELIAYCIHRRTGITRQEARAHCFFMDSKGLVCASRTDKLAPHKQPFAHDVPHTASLLEAVKAIKPTALIGVSTIPGAFDERVVRAMAELNDRPIILPLSNPTSKSECTFEQAWRWTDGRVIFASGSPFDPLTVDEAGHIIQGPVPSGTKTRTLTPSQANNAYIFPALGLAAVLTRASHLTDEGFLVAAEGLAGLADQARVVSYGELFPPFSNILDASAHVAAAVAEHLASSGVGRRLAGCEPAARPEETHARWVRHISATMWRSPAAPASRQASLIQIEPNKLQEIVDGAISSGVSRL